MTIREAHEITSVICFLAILPVMAGYMVALLNGRNWGLWLAWVTVCWLGAFTK